MYCIADGVAEYDRTCYLICVHLIILSACRYILILNVYFKTSVGNLSLHSQGHSDLNLDMVTFVINWN